MRFRADPVIQLIGKRSCNLTKSVARFVCVRVARRRGIRPFHDTPLSSFPGPLGPGPSAASEPRLLRARRFSRDGSRSSAPILSVDSEVSYFSVPVSYLEVPVSSLSLLPCVEARETLPALAQVTSNRSSARRGSHIWKRASAVTRVASRTNEEIN